VSQSHPNIRIIINIVACRAVAIQRPRDGGYTRAVPGQRLGKHVPAAINRRATIEVLLETGCFYVVPAEKLPCDDQVSSVREAVKIELECVKLINRHC
jgi:hypothetical protein